MSELFDREMAISARALDDLCALAELAANMRASEHGEDSLVNGLRASVREVRVRATRLDCSALVG